MEDFNKGLEAIADELDALRQRPDSVHAARQLDDLTAEQSRLRALLKQLEGQVSSSSRGRPVAPRAPDLPS